MLKRILIIISLIGIGFVFFEFMTEFESSKSLHPVAERYVSKGPEEIGAANLVTAVVVTYRGLDTLGEVIVLFSAATGVGLLLKRREEHETPLEKRPASELVQTGSLFLVSLIFLVGIYIFINGHLTPGGGFQGGAVIASGVLLLLLAHPNQKISHTLLSRIESISGVVYVGIGTFGLWFAGGFLDNKLLGLGSPGNLFSAGAIPLIYICIGIKVGSELSNVLKNMQEA
jgi:multicomponent Na+:H+ antiporter subunit B